MPYRALLSIPIAAENDDEAVRIAGEQANSLMHPGGDCIAGHRELVTEVREASLVPVRVVYEEPSFSKQLPA